MVQSYCYLYINLDHLDHAGCNKTRMNIAGGDFHLATPVTTRAITLPCSGQSEPGCDLLAELDLDLFFLGNFLDHIFLETGIIG